MVHPSIRINLSIFTSIMMQDVPFEVVYLLFVTTCICLCEQSELLQDVPRPSRSLGFLLFFTSLGTSFCRFPFYQASKRSPKRTSADSWYWWLSRNPKQPPGMYKTLQIMGFQLPIPQLVFTPDFWTMNSITQKQAIFVQQTLKTASSDEELSFKQLLAPRMGRVLPLWR